MKSEFLKIAKCKTDKEFYKKYPSEAAFFKAHPEAKKLIKKAQVGIQVDSNGNGIPDFMENLTGLNPSMVGQTANYADTRSYQSQPASLPQAQSQMGTNQNFSAQSFPSLYTPNAQQVGQTAFQSANSFAMPNYGQQFINKANQTTAGMRGIPQALPKDIGYTAPKADVSFADKAAPYIGAAKDVISGIGSLKAQGKEKDRMRQMRKLTDVMKIASGTREQEPERRYVRPEDMIVQPDQMFPTYGVGSNVLTARSGAEIQNTYAPGTIYDDGGYEPLNDSDRVKQYYYGGGIPTAQDGGGFMDFMQSQGGGQALGMLTNAFSSNSGESQIGQGLGTAAGTLIGGPVGGMLGGALGGIAGGMLNTSQKSIKRDRRAIQKNVDTMMGNQFGQAFQNQYSSVVRNGGNFPNYEEGGQLTNPQLITRFGELDEQDFYDYAHQGMDTLRAGGNLRSYTPPTNRAMQTYAMGGELETHWGGEAETMSYNPYLPGQGETVMFRGQSHDESDGKGNTGIGITYGNSPVEVERGEPAVKLKDGSSGEENLTVYGNLKIPNEYIPLLGDEKAKGKKFKNYIAEISKDEAKQNKLVEKSTNLLNSLDVKNSFDKLKFDALTANINGANMKLKSIADKKMNAASLQNAINDTAEEYGLVADDLARGKAKIDKEAMKEYAEYGKSIKKAEPGITTDDGKKITRAEKERLIKSGQYKVDPSDPNKIYRVKSKSATSEQKKSASALGYIPKGQSVDPTTGLSTKITPKQFEEFKERNKWYDWSKFDPKDPNSVNDFANKFNEKAKEIGSDAKIIADKDGKVTIVGEQYISGKLEEAKKETPGSTESDYLEVEDEDKRYETTPYKRSVLMDVANQILPFIRPTDQEPLDSRQLYGEMYALSSNQLEPVQAQTYQPELLNTYDISLQDQLNANQADFNAMQRMAGYNPAAQSMLAAQKYAANTGVLGEQFRQNQAMDMGIYNANTQTLNDAKLKNLAIYDTQYGRQAQAKSNTKAITQAALSSIGDKYAKNRLENRELGIMENMYNYRFDPAGRAINMNPLYQPNMPTVYGKQTNPNMVPVKDADGNIIEYRSITPSSTSMATPTYVQSTSSTSPAGYTLNEDYTPIEETQEDVYDEVAPKRKGGTIKKKYSQSSIVKAYKNL